MDSPKICVICSSKQLRYFTYQSHNYFKCTHCEIVSTYPYPTKVEIISYYKRKFKTGNYKLLRKYQKDYAVIYNQFATILTSYIKKDKKKLAKLSILDVGCFTGEFLEIMKNYGLDVYGIELQAEAVAIANKKLPHRIFKREIMSQDFPPQKFDVITLFGVLEHVTDPLKLLQKINKSLKKDGILMIQTPNSSTFLAKLLQKYWPPYAPVEHIHLFGEKNIKLALKKTGYKVEVFRNHTKYLPLGYVYAMFQNYGPEFYRFFSFFSPLIKRISSMKLPFYVGEMIVIARKK